MSTRIGVDVGGTFTDLIFFDGETGQVTVGKGPSNPRDVDLAVRSVVTSTLDPEAASRTELFLHGTTVGLNALLERKGARVGLLTTDGFRDILEQARMERLDERGHRVGTTCSAPPRRWSTGPCASACGSGSSLTEACTLRSTPTASARPSRSSPERASSAWRSCSSTRTPTPRTNCAPRSSSASTVSRARCHCRTRRPASTASTSERRQR